MHDYWYVLFRRPLPLERETAAFILVNAFDVFMTYFLLRFIQGDGIRAVESNPIADLFFDGLTMKGMVFFKFTLVAVVTVITQIIARERVEVARKVLNFGTLIVVGVVIYSFLLLLKNSNVL